VNVALLTPEDVRWSDMLARTPHDVYHLPRYCAFAATQENGTPAALYSSRGGVECLVPLVVRTLPERIEVAGATCDAASPYGYASPLLTSGAEPANLRAAIAACLDVAKHRGMVSVFLRLHPLLTEGHLELASEGVFVHHGETVYLDLTESPKQLEAQFVSGHRYEIRRLRRLGFRTTLDEWDHLLAFAQMYRQTMNRVSADSSYIFADDYFTGLREALGTALHLCLVYSSDDIIAAGALFTDCGDIMQYHLSGVSEPFVRLSPTKLLISEIASWGHTQKRKIFHLGGGVGSHRDSLFRFKEGFSALRADFCTCRFIVQPTAYESLVARRAARAAIEPASSGGFFPAYRAPLN
jgi:Acetyltransferase (GNAT) domain